jgi:DNA repair exonuclease SbcCD nuclease subunit
MTERLRYLVLSDVHLGSKNNPTEEIIANLDTFFEDYSPKSDHCKLDIIFIAGDLFDRLLDMDDENTHLIKLWLDRLSRFCSRENISLRILKGTPSHDWNQSSQAETVWKISQTPGDFKYIDILSIEYMEKHDIHVLYVPDEWAATTQETLDQVKTLMAEMQLKTVDIAIMHGLFNYQLPGVGKTTSKHDELSYLELVKYFINIGHIHTHSTYERILAQGSFDRLTHGEEEPKGAMLMILDPDDGNKFFFLENKKAKIFKTITLKLADVDRCLESIDKQLLKIPINSYIRIKARKDHGVYQAFEELKLRYPLYHLSKKSLEDEEEAVHNEYINDLLGMEYSSVQIERSNITTLLFDEIQKKHSLNTAQQTIFNTIMTNTLTNMR